MDLVSVIAREHTKKSLAEMAEKAVEQASESGQELKAYVRIKQVEEFVDQFRKKLAPLARIKLEAYGKTVGILGATVSQSENGIKYNWSRCQDPVLERLTLAADKAKKELENRQDMLKKLPVQGMVMIDEETGEECKVYPPSKTSESSLKVELMK